jgi:hypothetical protein
VSGQNVQVIADVGVPVNGTRHDAAAYYISGIADRWADHLTDGGPGMIGDSEYQSNGPITPHKNPPGGELTANIFRTIAPGLNDLQVRAAPRLRRALTGVPPPGGRRISACRQLKDRGVYMFK